MIVVNTKGIEINPPADWIKAAGTYTLKITEVKPDGYNADGFQKIKMFFKSSAGEQHSEMIVLSPAALWKLKQIEIAIGAPEVYDLNNFVGRYVIADIKGRIHKDKEYFDIKTFSPCPLNDKLPKIPELIEDAGIVSTPEDIAEAEELF